MGRVPSCRAPCLSACRWPFPVGSGQAGGRGPAVLGALPGASLSPEAVIGPRSLGRRQMRGWKHGPLRGNRGRADLWGARVWAGHFAKGFTLTSHLTPITPLGAGRRSHRWETEAARHLATRQQGAGPGVEPRSPGPRWRNPAAPSATSDGRFTPGWLRMHPLATPRRGRVRGSAPEGWAAVRRRRIGRDRVLAGNSTRRLPGLETRPSQRPRMSDPVSVEGPGEARPWGRDVGQRRRGCRPAGGAGQAGRSEARSWEAGSFGLGPHGLSVFYPFVQLSEPSPG